MSSTVSSLRPFGVADRLVELGHVTHQVRLSADRDVSRSGTGGVPTTSRSKRPSLYFDASRISAIVPTVAIDAAPGPDLAAVPDQDDAERLVPFEATPGHRPVALLEDPERQGNARAEDGVEREERAAPRSAAVTGYGNAAGVAHRRRRIGGRAGRPAQWAQPRGAPPSSAVRKLEPQPQAATAFGLLTVKPAPIRVST